MSDPFANMVSKLRGKPGRAVAISAAQPARAELIFSRVGRAAEFLRQSDDPEVLAVAEGLEAWLRAGGDIAAKLGVKARRGHCRDLPAHAAREREKRTALCSLMELLQLGEETPEVAGKVLHKVLSGPQGPVVLHDVGVTVELPTSACQLTKIIRGLAA